MIGHGCEGKEGGKSPRVSAWARGGVVGPCTGAGVVSSKRRKWFFFLHVLHWKRLQGIRMEMLGKQSRAGWHTSVLEASPEVDTITLEGMRRRSWAEP